MKPKKIRKRIYQHGRGGYRQNGVGRRGKERKQQAAGSDKQRKARARDIVGGSAVLDAHNLL